MLRLTERELSTEIIKKAVFISADILSNMGYHGEYGSIHLLKLNIQTNTLTAILHNLIAWKISELDNRWVFHPKGGGTPDLTNINGLSLQVKVSSDKYIKGNQVSVNQGDYLITKYERTEYTVRIILIMIGELKDEDWNKPKGTQLAILKNAALANLRMIFP